MIVGFTGHRPNRITNRTKVLKQTVNTLRQLKPEKAYVGMAEGFDLWAGTICIEYNIPYVAVLPFDSHVSKRKQYQDVYNNAIDVIIVCLGSYADWKYIARDKWIVDHSDMMIAAYDGIPHGGTHITVEYAIKKEKPITYIEVV